MARVMAGRWCLGEDVSLQSEAECQVELLRAQGFGYGGCRCQRQILSTGGCYAGSLHQVPFQWPQLCLVVGGAMIMS